MKKIYEFSQFFMDRIDIPNEAKDEFNRVQKIIMDNSMFRKKYCRLRKRFLLCGKQFYAVQDSLNSLAKEMDVNEYTVHFVFLMSFTKKLLKDYHRKGVPEEIYWDTMCDLKYKLIECYNVKGIWGTFVASWYGGFFRMTRFALGRFQFEFAKFNGDEDYVLNGVTIKPKQQVIGMHIPSSGVPLTDEIRLDSYRRCYEFYKDHFKDQEYMPMTCGSWLLFEKHYEFLPEKLNIIKFMNDFDIIKSSEVDTFGDAWRIFDSYAEKPIDEWPTDTSLRKAYVDWVKSGNKVGSGYGIFLFDGKQIINSKNS